MTESSKLRCLIRLEAVSLIKSETHANTWNAQRDQRDRIAIAEGLAQMEAGQGKPLEQAVRDIRSRLGFPFVQ